MKTAVVPAAAVLTAAGVLLVPVLVGRGDSPRPQAAAASAATSLTPRAHLFGDHVHAQVSVALDPRRVDPRSVTIETSFAPYETLGKARLARGAAAVQLDATLVCLARACLTDKAERTLAFPPARVRYRDRSGGAHSAQVAWPSLLAASRLTPADVRRPQLRVTGGAPPVATPVDPIVVGWALAAGAAALLVAAGGALVRRLRPTSVPAESAAPELPPLLAALERVDRLVDDGDRGRRSAIDRLARELNRAGLTRLVPGARALAWSSPVPAVEPMEHLSADVQKAVDAA